MEFEIYFFNKNELCTNYLVRQPLIIYINIKHKNTVKIVEIDDKISCLLTEYNN